MRRPRAARPPVDRWAFTGFRFPPEVHGRLKARLRPMRGLKRFRSAARIAAGHAFVQNLRRGHYELATNVSPPLRLATAFTELALAM